MARIANMDMAGQSTTTSFGDITFDEAGISDCVTCEAAEALCTIPGWDIVVEEPKESKEEEIAPTKPRAKKPPKKARG